MIEKYYEEELRYLYESGKEFARAHPDRARFLNIDAVGDRDPYVERLFEGFAFLTARVREKLDDSLPELTEGLINLMWPQFLQDIPSAAIVQFRPRRGLLNETRLLARGAEVLSGPVGDESVACRFVTTQDVKLSPISLRSANKQVDTRGNASLVLEFEIDPKASWRELSLSPLRLYIHGERPTALMLREFLTARVVSSVINVNNGQVQYARDGGKICTPAGYLPQESLLPADQRSFWSSALLLEYFVYPEKFLFVDLWGFERIQACDPAPERVSVTITFAGDFPANRAVSADNFRLFCSPVVNLYKSDTEPVLFTGRRDEYRLCADASHPRSVRVHSVTRVTGIDRVTGRRTDYEPLTAFKAGHDAGAHTFSTRRTRTPAGADQTALVIGGETLDGLELREQNLTVEAWCSNGVLPREEVGEGGIDRGGKDFPDYIMVSNITRPTLAHSPPDSEDYLWLFLSQQASNYLSFASPQNLKSFLRLYNRSGHEGAEHRIEAITDVAVEPAETMLDGSIVRGVAFSVSLQASHFEDSGEIRLFGEVLQEFLSQYISINSFLELRFVLKPSGRTLTFGSSAGTQWLI